MNDDLAESHPHLGFDHLKTAELFVVWSLRERLAGGAESERLTEGFRRSFGAVTARSARSAFEDYFVLLTEHLIRDFALMPPCCGCISRDETLLLRLIALVQNDHTPEAVGLARTLVGPAKAMTLCNHVDRFAALLKHHRLTLPLRPLLTLVPDATRTH